MKKKGIWMAGLLLCMVLAGCGKEQKDNTETGSSKVEQTYVAKMPEEKEKAEVFVAPVKGISDDFIKGMDISSVISEEESGVCYSDMDGTQRDLFELLADSGVNYIRVRVWNNPYDEDGNGYGGGNCDVKKAAEIGKRAAECGMKLLVDFHYSDFWADPKKQFAPVEWRRIPIDEKSKLLSEFTVEALQEIIDKGADVGMVQIGNEINNGMAGEYDTENILKLLDEASKAVRKVAKEEGQEIQIAVHYTEIDDVNGTMEKAKNLEEANIDYDIFGVSYYPFWHGTMENMTSVLKDIKETFGKETCVLETSYAYTGEDGDGFGNSVSEGDLLEEYPATVQGQTSCIRDIIAAASDAGSLGVFYWEGAWVPVGSDLKENEKKWEEYGSGWASSFSTQYDPQDAGKYYGGCSWDNQAMFDFTGKKLSSLDVFKYVNHGATCEPEVMVYKEVNLEVGIGQPLSLPEEIEAIYNDPSCTDGVPVTWDDEQVAAIDTKKADTYSVSGCTKDGTTITATVKVCNVNLVANPGYEEPDMSAWKVTDNGGGNTTDILEKAADALSGEKSFHFYSESEINFDVEQTVKGFAAGKYTLVSNIQGGDIGASDIYLYAKVGEEIYKSEPVTLEGWVKWQTPKITDINVPNGAEVIIGMHVSGAAKGWGTIDDWEFFAQS